MEDIKKRPIRSYVLRQGRLTKFQSKAIEELSSFYLIDFEKKELDWDQIFENQHNKKVIEIGFGMGSTTAEIAQDLKDINFIGIEVHSPGVGNLLNLIKKNEIQNLRILQHDAVEVFKAMVADLSLDGIHIFFPDPWHKKRHHKRRLIQEQFLELIHPKLKHDGYLHIATDWEGYAEWIMEIINVSKYFEFSSDDFFKKPDYRANTKYESRGVRLGHKVWDFLIRKR